MKDIIVWEAVIPVERSSKGAAKLGVDTGSVNQCECITGVSGKRAANLLQKTLAKVGEDIKKFQEDRVSRVKVSREC